VTFLGTLVDQQHDERDLGVVGGNGVGDALQEHGLAGARRRNDQAALSLPQRCQQVHHAAGVVLLDGFQLDALVGVEGRQVVEEDLVAGFLGRLEIDGVHLDEREVPLAFLGRANLAGDGVAGAQIESPDLRRRDVDVVRARQIVVLGRAQKAETVGQALEHAFGKDQPALFGLGLEDLEDQLLLAQAGGAGDPHILGYLVELLDAHVFQLDQVQRGGSVLDALGGLAALVARPAMYQGRRRFGRRGRGRIGGFSLGGGRRGRGFPLRALGTVAVRFFSGRRGAGGFFGRFGGGRLFLSRLFGGFFLRRGVSYRGFSVFDIACQVSLTPRPVMAENGNGSAPSSRMARKPRSCSD